MKAIDKAISAISPSWAASRAASRLEFNMLSGPYGETLFNDRFRLDRSFRSRPVDEDNLQGRANRGKLRQDCFDLYRTSGLAKAAVNRIADYATVCRPYAITTDDAWNREAMGFWEWWCQQADSRFRLDMCEMTRLVHIADHLAGQMMFLFTTDGRLQPIESERIATPSEFKSDPMVVDGIRTDATGRITHYYVCKRGRHGNVDTVEGWRRVPAINMVHISNVWRPDMLHGVPRLHAAVQKLADYDETDAAMRLKVKNEARQFYHTKNRQPLGGPRTRTAGDGLGAFKVRDTAIGQVYEGEEINLIESKSPNASYTPHMIEEGKAVAAAVDIPYEYLMMIFTAGSYNAQKGARLAFADTCIRRANMATKQFHQRVWNWRIAKAIKEKAIPPAPTFKSYDGIVRNQWNRVEWAKPRFTDIDMGRDVSAKSAAWAAGQQSLRDQRTDPYQVLRDKAEDILNADQIADQLNKHLKTGQANWHHIINAGVPGMTVPVDDDADGEPKGKTDEE